MTILSRHFVARYLTAFAVTLALLVLAVTSVQMLMDLGEIVEARGGLWGALRLLALELPAYYLPYLAPIAAFVAAFLALGLAARRLETVALKASGISPVRIVAPLLVTALFLTGADLAFNESVGAAAGRAWRSGPEASRAELAFRAGSFWYRKGDLIYNVREADPDARSLRGVWIYQLDPHGRLLRSIHAARARVEEGGSWRLSEAVVRDFDPSDPTAPPRFDRRRELRLELEERPELVLLGAEVSALSLRELREYLDSRGRSEAELRRARTLLHQRLSSPFALLLLTLLAAPFGLRVERTRTLGAPALQGVIAVFLFYTAHRFGSTLAMQGVTPPAATLWGVLALFAAAGLWQLAREAR